VRRLRPSSGPRSDLLHEASGGPLRARRVQPPGRSRLLVSGWFEDVVLPGPWRGRALLRCRVRERGGTRRAGAVRRVCLMRAGASSLGPADHLQHSTDGAMPFLQGRGVLCDLRGGDDYARGGWRVGHGGVRGLRGGGRRAGRYGWTECPGSPQPTPPPRGSRNTRCSTRNVIDAGGQRCVCSQRSRRRRRRRRNRTGWTRRCSHG
jgi:hypothetical protein